MNQRIAEKIVRRAHPSRYTKAQVVAAASRIFARRVVGECCGTCPMPSAGCPRGRECDLWETAATLLLDIDHGHHPWGAWRCVMQRAAGIGR